MKDLKAFLHRQIEVFLNHEFGPGMQNMTPEGIRRILWEPEHTARLVGHLAGNWEMVEQAMNAQVEESKIRPGRFPTGFVSALLNGEEFKSDAVQI